MPQVTKEQVSLRQKDRKPALSLLFPSRLWAGCFSQQSCSRDGSQVTVALPWSFCIRDPSSLLMLPRASEDRVAPSDP